VLEGWVECGVGMSFFLRLLIPFISGRIRTNAPPFLDCSSGNPLGHATPSAKPHSNFLVQLLPKTSSSSSSATSTCQHIYTFFHQSIYPEFYSSSSLLSTSVPSFHTINITAIFNGYDPSHVSTTSTSPIRICFDG
jgi:hypothetical protein